MDKTTQRIVVIMNPWGRKEIKRAANLTPLRNVTEDHIDDTFDFLGPVPRLCIGLSSDELEEYKDALNTTISGISANQIGKLAKDTLALSMDAASQKIFLLSRKRWDDVHSGAVVAPITSSMQSRLAARCRNLL